MNLETCLEKNKLTLFVFLAGLFLAGLGMLGFKFHQFGEETKIEVLGEPVEKTEGTILVEIAGEIQAAGVYEMAIGSRVNDVLIKAGGLSAKADREWVTKNINLAQKLADGAKIYIPSVNLSNLSNSSNSPNLPNKININTATEKELDGLYGVGEATAKNIIAGRPYQRPEELVEKKIVKSNVWEKIKDMVTTF